MKKDVIVVGAGCAGMIAALEAGKMGAKVAIIDKGAIGLGTNSALSNGVFAGPTPRYSQEDYIRDTIQTGRGINHEPSVRLSAKEAPSGFSFLNSLGLELVEFPGCYVIQAAHNDHFRGLTLVKALAKAIRDSDGIELISDLYITDILKSEGLVCGVKGLEKNGEEIVINAPAVVMATGGGGAIYLRNDNQKRTMGQGYYLAAKAGLELWDMEFVQFYPLVLAHEGLPAMLIYPPYPKEAKLINIDGEDIIEKYGLGDITQAVSTSRDKLAAALFQEGSRGTTFLDYRRVSEHLWNKRPLSLLPKRFDFQHNIFGVSPAAHFFMGGVRTDENAQTLLPGLYACGEIVWGLHGANRIRGNALTECLVSGRIAGWSAAQFALDHQTLPPRPHISTSRNLASHNSATRGRLRELRQQIREVAWKYAGVMRHEDGLREGLEDIVEIVSELNNINPQTVYEKKLKEDLMSGSFVTRAILLASLSRNETRGSFIRKDFPYQDDLNWRKNSCLFYDLESGNFSITHHLLAE